MTTEPREPGWYWVKVSNFGVWQAAMVYGHPGNKCWQFDGQIFGEGVFAEIGPRIPTPDEMRQ